MIPILEAFLDIEPRSWKRTTGYGRRIMPTEQRDYYNRLYASMIKAGFKNCDKMRLGIKLNFYIKRRNSVPDIDNLEKAVLDAGQPSKWMKGRDFIAPPDLLNDRQFVWGEQYRLMGAPKNGILARLFEFTLEDDKSRLIELEPENFSTAGSLLKHAGTWKGDDAEKVFKEIRESRPEAKF